MTEKYDQLLKQIETLKTEIQGLKNAPTVEEKQSQEKQTIWNIPENAFPQDRNAYYIFLSDSRDDFGCDLFAAEKIDYKRQATLNFYRSQEIAEEDLAKQQLIAKIWKWKAENDADFKPDWHDEEQKKFLLSWNKRDNDWDVDFFKLDHYQFHLPYFSQREIADACLEHFGSELDLLLYEREDLY